MKTVAALVMALACTTAAFAQGNRAATEKALIANENKINEAVVKHDAATFNSMVAGDGVSADGAGFMPVSEFSKVFDQLKVSTWKISDAKVSWVDDKTAIVYYTWTGKGTFGGQPIPAKTYASTVWTEKGGKWVAVFHQETEAAPAPPPAPAKKK